MGGGEPGQARTLTRAATAVGVFRAVFGAAPFTVRFGSCRSRVHPY